MVDPYDNRDADETERAEPGRTTFHVRAPSINAVRRALHRAPGGVKVVGRHDRDTILCSHTMNEHSLGRHWAVIVSRLSKQGLAVVSRREPGSPESSPRTDR